jgi:hypothetical protein
MLRTTSPLASLCQVPGLPRSTLYDQAQSRDDQEVRQAIEAVAQQFPAYGTRRIAAGYDIVVPPVGLIRREATRWQQWVGKDAPDRYVYGVDPNRLHHPADLNRFPKRDALFLPRKKCVIKVDRIDLDLEMKIGSHLLVDRMYHLEQKTRPVL